MELQTALIAMSGGVDSSIAAYLTVRAGYECMGATLRLYHNRDIGYSEHRPCCTRRDTEDAAGVAQRLGIPFRVLDFGEAFHREVIDRFRSVYEAGGTPNPCIDCNRYIKFSLLSDWARREGYHTLVTGHYARIVKENGRYLLKKARDVSKDQSYVLCRLTREDLAHTLFPLGEMTKGEVRQLAESLGFSNAAKPDSQDICFVPDGDYAAFLERERGSAYPSGVFADRDGKVLGRHGGTVRFTVGQRRGLGLPMGERVYVTGKDMASDTVYVGREEELYHRRVLVEDVNLLTTERVTSPLRVCAVTRYRGAEAPATLSPAENGMLRLLFDTPQRAVTPGQTAVFYDGDTVVGGGTVAEVSD